MPLTRTSEHAFGKTYGGSAPEIYERYFVPAIGHPLATDLVDAAAVRDGERVLDVACGTGVVARVALARVGRKGTVAGADVNPAMLQEARSASEGAEPPIAWYETNAEAMPLRDASFDVVLCQAGLQFMADKEAALKEMRRVLVPGGRAFVTLPQPTPFFAVMEEAIARHIGADAASFVRLVFSLNDPKQLEQLLHRSGFSDVSVRVATKELHLPAPEEFLWQYIQATPLGASIMATDESRRAALQRDVVEGWRPWADEAGMTCQQGILVGSGYAGNR